MLFSPSRARRAEQRKVDVPSNVQPVHNALEILYMLDLVEKDVVHPTREPLHNVRVGLGGRERVFLIQALEVEGENPGGTNALFEQAILEELEHGRLSTTAHAHRNLNDILVAPAFKPIKVPRTIDRKCLRKVYLTASLLRRFAQGDNPHPSLVQRSCHWRRVHMTGQLVSIVAIHPPQPSRVDAPALHVH